MTATKEEPTVKGLQERAHALSVELMGTFAPCARGEGKDSCVTVEEKRPLTAAERERGWARRPFYGYDHLRMCDACAAYWHASMASICLLDLGRRQEIAAGQARRVVDDRAVPT